MIGELIKENIKIIFFCSLLFSLSFAVTSISLQGSQSGIKDVIEPVYNEIVKQIRTGELTISPGSIFKHNLITASLIYLSFIPYDEQYIPAPLIGTCLYLVANASIIAYMVFFMVEKGLNIYTVLFLLVPHGIFEIPALILVGTAGIRFWKSLITFTVEREMEDVKKGIRSSIILFFISILLFIIAAFIESEITATLAYRLIPK